VVELVGLEPTTKVAWNMGVSAKWLPLTFRGTGLVASKLLPLCFIAQENDLPMEPVVFLL